jgi:hypothetical protein
MDPNAVQDRAEALAAENARLRELLRRWLRYEREPANPADLLRLAEDTKRALFRLGPGWAGDED